MALTIFDAITIHISRPLEALFDELEYHLAKRALRRTAKLKARKSTQTKVVAHKAMATSATAISVKAT
jgi:hypothetical protein